MSLDSNLQAFIIAARTKFNSVSSLIKGNNADLSALTTTNKTSLLAAINEINGGIKPCGSAESNVSQSVPASTTTRITFQVTNFVVASVTHSAGVFTLPVDGIYFVYARTRLPSSASGSRSLQIRKNNLRVAEFVTCFTSQDNSNTGGVLVQASAGDTIDMALYQNSGAAMNVLSTSNGTGLILYKVT